MKRMIASLIFALHALISFSPSAATTNIADATQSRAPGSPAGVAASRSAKPFNGTPYAKASELSVRPSPIGEIRVPSPENAAAQRVITTRVTLFIDEKGIVKNIEFDNLILAKPFRDAVDSAFAKARFNPGRIGDRPVKARMRIEVTFEPNPESGTKGLGAASAKR